VHDRLDRWMPVLFLRLRDGRIWSGFSGTTDEFESWDSLISSILNDNCIAILGPGLIEPLIGTRRDIALRWAKESRYPLSPYDQEDFPRVAQFVEYMHSKKYVREHLNEVIRLVMCIYYPEVIGEKRVEKPTWNWEEISAAIEEVAKKLWSGEGMNPFGLVARLRLSNYITALYLDLLSPALKRLDNNIEPQITVCPWNKEITRAYAKLPQKPTPDKPWIFHLYGRFNIPASLVLTEDDFFDYLIGMSNDLIPKKFYRTLVDKSLLFLGFQVDDWTFRTLFSIISNLGGKSIISTNTNAAVQITPNENRIQDYRLTRHYLQTYFKPYNINLYWGNVEDFLKELVSRTDYKRSQLREPSHE